MKTTKKQIISWSMFLTLFVLFLTTWIYQWIQDARGEHYNSYIYTTPFLVWKTILYSLPVILLSLSVWLRRKIESHLNPRWIPILNIVIVCTLMLLSSTDEYALDIRPLHSSLYYDAVKRIDWDFYWDYGKIIAILFVIVLLYAALVLPEAPKQTLWVCCGVLCVIFGLSLFIELAVQIAYSSLKPFILFQLLTIVLYFITLAFFGESTMTKKTKLKGVCWLIKVKLFELEDDDETESEYEEADFDAVLLVWSYTTDNKDLAKALTLFGKLNDPDRMFHGSFPSDEEIVSAATVLSDGLEELQEFAPKCIPTLFANAVDFVARNELPSETTRLIALSISEMIRDEEMDSSDIFLARRAIYKAICETVGKTDE